MKRQGMMRYCNSRKTNEAAFLALATLIDLLDKRVPTPEQMHAAVRQFYSDLQRAAQKIGYGLFNWQPYAQPGQPPLSGCQRRGQ